MRIVCVGGGPAGLYFATSVKLRNSDHSVTIVERNPKGVTYGWGVVFNKKLLCNLLNNDFESAQEIHYSSVRWDRTEVYVQGKQVLCVRAHGRSTDRRRLLDILAKRAMDLGADIKFEYKAEDLSEFADADLIVACDGINSRLRHLYANDFRTNIEVHKNKYIWLGTYKVFDAFTFGFQETSAGWIWFHAYRFDNDTSTFIVECSPKTWEGLDFDKLGLDETIALLEEIFQPYLSGHSLVVKEVNPLGKAPWLNFQRISNENWYHGNVVLMGDAAHTTHFTIGSGTMLALEDAIGLAQKLHEEHKDLQAALKAYEVERRHALLLAQRTARKSTQWFENIQHYINQDAREFAFSLLNRTRG